MLEFHTTMGSAIGPAHVTQGTPCQDAVTVVERNGLTLIAVADGAGSLEYSELGAAEAIDSVTRELDDVDGATIDAAVYLVETARADVLARNDSELGCTLALLITDGRNWATAGIGDSFVVVDAENDLRAFSSPAGEYANITQLLTSREVEVWTGEGTDFVAGAACSDGLEHYTLVDEQPHGLFWNDVFARVRRGTEIQSIIDFMDTREMLDDDTSAAICVMGMTSEE